MRKTVITAILLLLAIASCEEKQYTNEFSGTIWEGMEISKELWDDQLGFPPDTTYHRLEFKEWSDHLVGHYYLSKYDNEWHYRDLFDYQKTYSGIRMEWEVTYYGDTLTRRFELSNDKRVMKATGEFYTITLNRVN